MQPIPLTLTILLALCATLLCGCSRARIDRPVTEHTLRGSYYFLVTETRLEDGRTQHCEAHGTANVFPDGRMTICGPTMCNGTPGTPELGLFNYVITGNELTNPYRRRCRRLHPLQSSGWRENLALRWVASNDPGVVDLGWDRRKNKIQGRSCSPGCGGVFAFRMSEKLSCDFEHS